MNETAPRNRLLVWCWPENPAVLDLLSGHTGISIDDDHYSFWPDTDAWDRGSPVPAPGKERERELYEQDFREDPEKGHPAFRGGWLGKVTKESATELATRFFMKTAYAAQPRAKQRYAADAEGVIYGPDVPYARVYGFAASQSQLTQVTVGVGRTPIQSPRILLGKPILLYQPRPVLLGSSRRGHYRLTEKVGSAGAIPDGPR